MKTDTLDPTATERTATRSPLAMTPEEREAFLAGDHVGVVVLSRPDGAAPLASPVWYGYVPGGPITFVTGTGTEKARLLATGAALTFLVQDEAPPQRFVAVEGVRTIETTPDEATRRRIAERYLPPDAVDGFLATTPSDLVVAVHITPTRWRSSDFGKLAP